MTCLYIYSSANPDWIHDRRSFDQQRNHSIGAPVAKLSDPLPDLSRRGDNICRAGWCLTPTFEIGVRQQ
jgi:hypothetical protein